MTPRHWKERRELVPHCAGSGRPAKHPRGQVGYCPNCGVRTFITDTKTIASHGSLSREIVEFQRRGRIPV